MKHISFSLYKGTSDTKGVKCNCELFAEVINQPSLRQQVERIRQYLAISKAEEASKAKKQLPACTFSGLSTDGSHKAESMQPTSLYMLDVDHVDDPDALWLSVLSRIAGCEVPDQPTAATLLHDPTCVAALERTGLAMAYKTPSGHGLRLVAWRVKPELRTIAANQAWLAEQTGITDYDTGCKDISRLSFLVHRADFYYLDTTLWQREDNLPFEAPAAVSSAAAASPAATASGIAPQKPRSTYEQKNFKYNGHLISEIADCWVEEHGKPVYGHRHDFYKDMAFWFRNITDMDPDILLCQLPDLGLDDIQERRDIVEHVCKKKCIGFIPNDFAQFLTRNGFLTDTPEDATTDDPTESCPPLPRGLPPVFKELCSLYPKTYHFPVVVTVLTVLGTLATRLRATYLDGQVHTPSFIGVIYGPASSGKSHMGRIFNLLTRHLSAHDEVSQAKEALYKRNVRALRNAQVSIPEPHAPFRIVPAVNSVAKLLSRQQDAMGLHQLSFVPEIDTLVKSNSGGAWKQKTDLYRMAYDNDAYGQDYMSEDTFSGTIKLYYNILMTGTINQMRKFFPDPENGLVSRACFAPIEEQEFAPLPHIKKLTAEQQSTIDAVLDRFEAMTYARKSDVNDGYTVKPEVNLDGKIGFLRKPLEDWLEEQRMRSLKMGNTSLDQFRKRSAGKAFRLGMVCVSMYDELTPTVKGQIKRFVLWFADTDLYYIEKAFGEKLRQQLGGTSKKEAAMTNIYNELPTEFTSADLQATLARHNRLTNFSNFTSHWAKNGLIRRTGKSSFIKIKPKKDSNDEA